MDLDMAETYLRFVRERHIVWERRQAGEPAPWSDDVILRDHKFTNTYRVLDVGSQFVRSTFTSDPGDDLMRAFLYRYTNRTEPWDYFLEQVGRYPRPEDLVSGALTEVWGDYKAAGRPLFGNAFKMFCGVENAGMDRLSWVLGLTTRYFSPDGPDDITEEWLRRDDPAARHALLKTIPRCADFMAMQILTDTGYADWSDHDENAFVAAGPGAIKGARAIFDRSLSPYAAIRWGRGALSGSGPVLLTPNGRLRSLSLMDVQNTLCEFSKYVRYMGAPGTSRYRPAHPGAQPYPDLPAHW